MRSMAEGYFHRQRGRPAAILFPLRHCEERSDEAIRNRAPPHLHRAHIR